MDFLEYHLLRNLFPNADDNTMFDLQKKINYARLQRFQEECNQAQKEGQEVAKIFVESFDKELEKLFK